MKERFLAGRIVATPGALAAPEASGEQPFENLARHISGDWGEVDEHDRQENDVSLTHAFQLLSAYTLHSGVKIWVLNRTTLLNFRGSSVRLSLTDRLSEQHARREGTPNLKRHSHRLLRSNLTEWGFRKADRLIHHQAAERTWHHCACSEMAARFIRRPRRSEPRSRSQVGQANRALPVARSFARP